jgi:hypothetical protein
MSAVKFKCQGIALCKGSIVWRHGEGSMKQIFPDLRERLAGQGAVLESSTPEQMAAIIKSDPAK